MNAVNARILADDKRPPFLHQQLGPVEYRPYRNTVAKHDLSTVADHWLPIRRHQFADLCAIAQIQACCNDAGTNVDEPSDVVKVDADQRFTGVLCLHASQLFSEALRCTDAIGYRLVHSI